MKGRERAHEGRRRSSQSGELHTRRLARVEADCNKEAHRGGDCVLNAGYIDRTSSIYCRLNLVISGVGGTGMGVYNHVGEIVTGTKGGS